MSEVFFYADGTFFAKFQGGNPRGIAVAIVCSFACAGGAVRRNFGRSAAGDGADAESDFAGGRLYAVVARGRRLEEGKLDGVDFYAAHLSFLFRNRWLWFVVEDSVRPCVGAVGRHFFGDCGGEFAAFFVKVREKAKKFYKFITMIQMKTLFLSKKMENGLKLQKKNIINLLEV